ncbi:Ig-like domain-containing protein [Marinicrinis lubricantis]|uniref:Ig-like domain-containing protein n=1 Tax=Marinicrinis lubricantis TaxID=2086470 RepID=A0ABW1IPC9_9BACL
MEKVVEAVNVRIAKKIAVIWLTLIWLGTSLWTVPALNVEGAEPSTVTIDSHQDGDIVAAGIIRLSGAYSNAYDLKIVVNGTKVDKVRVKDDGTESGTWHYDLNTSVYDEKIEIVVIGSDSVTRYGVWSPFMTLLIDNPKASVPKVSIVDPVEQKTVQGMEKIRTAVDAKNQIVRVEIRVNGGPWEAAEKKGKHYELKWDTKRVPARTNSIEARAIDMYGNEGCSLTKYVRTKGAVSDPVTTVSQDRAIWIWESESYPLVMNAGSREVLRSLAQDTETFGQDPITTLYLGVDTYFGSDMLEDEREKVRNFVSWAHEEGFQVQALIAGGTKPPYFGAYERYHDIALREFEKVLNYNLSSEPAEQFDGVNIDIEPYIAADFKSDKPSIQIQYLDLLRKIVERRDASGLNLPLGPAIPRWYDTSDTATDIPWNGATKPLNEHIQELMDYIAIMDYRDQAEGSVGIIAQAQNEIDYAMSIGKKHSVVIGVESKDIADGGDPEMISFREEGRAWMESELNKVYDAFSDNSAFAGIALHQYEDIQKLPSQWGPDARWWEPPADHQPPSAVSGWPSAAAFDYQSIEISYGMASDNTEVDEYRIYRGMTADFPADEAHLAGTSRSLSYLDKGLLPETTYYYKVAAVDAQGNLGPVSSAVSAVTGSTELKPMIIGEMTVTYESGRGLVYLKVVDMETGQRVPAVVHGRYTYMGGKYIDVKTNAEGVMTAQSELVDKESGMIGFQVNRLNAPGYYWASAYDHELADTVQWGQ